ncbi:MAG: hypothetical protein ACRC6E_10900 [Fusobacteriaceae bacterium]
MDKYNLTGLGKDKLKLFKSDLIRLDGTSFTVSIKELDKVKVLLDLLQEKRFINIDTEAFVKDVKSSNYYSTKNSIKVTIAEICQWIELYRLDVYYEIYDKPSTCCKYLDELINRYK